MIEELRAQEFRDAFAMLPDEHVLSFTEIDIIPVVLGGNAFRRYSSEDGQLLSITAYEKNISSAGDLRAILAEHPRLVGDEEGLPDFTGDRSSSPIP